MPVHVPSLPHPSAPQLASTEPRGPGLLMVAFLAMLPAVGAIVLIHDAGTWMLILAILVMFALVGVVGSEMIRLLNDEDDGDDARP